MMRVLLLTLILSFGFCFTVSAQLPVGSDAPEIKLPDSSGKWLPLSSVKAKLILLDFWAVWCYPCVKSMPDVMALEEKYREHGLVVYAVSLDKGYYNWIEYLRKTKPPFVHVNDAYSFNGPSCRDYKIQSIPNKMLLKDGKVIAADMSLYDLEQVIRKELNLP